MGNLFDRQRGGAPRFVLTLHIAHAPRDSPAETTNSYAMNLALRRLPYPKGHNQSQTLALLMCGKARLDVDPAFGGFTRLQSATRLVADFVIKRISQALELRKSRWKCTPSQRCAFLGSIDLRRGV